MAASTEKSRLNPEDLQEYLEAETGIQIRARRPHEFPVALLLRPFSKSHWLTDIHRHLPDYAVSDANSFHFIGLERRGLRLIPVRYSLWYLAIPFLLLFASIIILLIPIDITLLRYFSILTGIISSAVISYFLFARVKYRMTHKIRTADDLQAAIEHIQARKDSQHLSFFESSDEIWQTVILNFAEMADVIIADVADFTKNVKWEVENLSRYRDKIVFYSLSFESAELSEIKNLLSPDSEIKVVRRPSSFGNYIYGDLVKNRWRYDREVSTKILRQLISHQSWADDYWSGIEKLQNKEFNEAVNLLQTALNKLLADVEKDSAHDLFPYVAIALAEAMTWTRMRGQRYVVLSTLLLHDIENHPKKNDIEMIREALKLSENTDLPLAIWQYVAILNEGLQSEIILHTKLTTANYLIPGTEELVSVLQGKKIFDWASNETVLEMGLGFAYEALVMSTEFKDKQIEGLACLLAARASYLRKDKKAFEFYVNRGLKVTPELSNDSLEKQFQELRNIADSSEALL